MNRNADYKSPMKTNYTRSSIERFAEKVAQTIDYQPAADLVQLVEEKLGGKIEFLDPYNIGQSEDGSIIVDGPNNFIIYLPGFTGELRNKFTIAHELGHYFIHSEQGKTKLKAARRGSEPYEWEANWFAAAFLMPENKIKKEYETIAVKEKRDTISYLSSIFLVNPKAIEVRLKSLGLLKE